jgi:outer membrane protein assembly factor BamD
VGLDPGAGVRRAALLALVVLAAGCAGSLEPDVATLSSNSAQVIWEAGQKAAEHKNWATARKYFRRIIDGFPQSELVPAARLGLADAFFSEGGTANRILAASAYREFLTFYPSHPRADYAQFRVAESYFAQKNPPDRDQTPTHQALEEYQRLLDVYPDSAYVEQARQRIKQCRQTLARHEFDVGYFYQRTRRAYRAAINRFKELLQKYPDYDSIDEVLYRLADALAAAHRPAEALPELARLLEDYPNSARADDARKLLAEVKEAVANTAPAADAPVPTPSPSPGPSPSPAPTP